MVEQTKDKEIEKIVEGFNDPKDKGAEPEEKKPEANIGEIIGKYNNPSTRARKNTVNPRSRLKGFKAASSPLAPVSQLTLFISFSEN